MIRINLLPLEDRPKPKHLPLPNKWSLLIYGLVIVLFVVGGVMYFRQNGELTRLVELKQKLDAEQKVLAEQTKAIERLELQASLLEERLQVVGRLEDIRYENVEWLNALNRVLPRDLWLTALTRNPSGGRTTLEGMADGYGPISQLMKSMETSAAFTAPTLIKAERTSDKNGSMISFNVVANWGASRGGASAAETEDLK